ncbi:MAG: DegT/DnrJ/EryC1/StrS family aminotransferase [Gammaproteobacteria bacterium]|nr:DegT/DnrJ/EryC1/StrS family aminotransferase [Gammaproteobacteria bacterium]
MQFIDLKTQYETIKADVDRRMAEVLAHGRFIMGPEVVELEERLADYVGVKHCIGVASGTDALLIALMALGVGRDDEIITTPFSFIATAETIVLLGARPVFVDIDPRTYNLAPALIAAAITPRTRAIMPVSLYGQCADMDAINAVATAHGLPVIEDGAQSFGATYKGRRSCGLSTIGATSFFPSKPLGCYGDGGACFTDDDDLATAMREIRVHGQDRRYHHPRIGINGRLDTIQAAVLLAKMAVFPGEVEARARVGARYSELLADADCVTPHIEEHNTSVYAQYTLQVEQRERFVAGLQEAGVPVAVHYPVPLHEQPALAGRSRVAGEPAQAAAAARRVVSLPMHPFLAPAAVMAVAEVVRSRLAP